MNHDGNSNGGEDDETPEEMVNRSLAQAFDNQQRYMEFFQHSANMLQVLSRFMADPVVVHDLEEDVSETVSSSSNTDSSHSSEPCSIDVCVSSSLPAPSLNDVPRAVICEIVESNLNSTTTIEQNTSNSPQSCRTRRRQPVINRIGWSSDSEGFVTQTNFVEARSRPELRTTCHTFQTQHVVEKIIGEDNEWERSKAYSNTCSPLSTTCLESPNTGKSTRQDTDLETTSSSVKQRAPSVEDDDSQKFALEDLTDHPVQNSGGGDGQQKIIGSSANQQDTSYNETMTNPPETSGNNVATPHNNPAQKSVISEARAYRFSVGMSTQASIKTAMSEISKAADTIRQARNMLSSINLPPSVQVNNNNHDSVDPESDNDERIPHERKYGMTNILKLVQPVEPTFNATNNLSLGGEVKESSKARRCGSPRHILVKPVSECELTSPSQSYTQNTSTESDTLTIPISYENLSSHCKSRDNVHDEYQNLEFMVDDENDDSINDSLNSADNAMAHDKQRSMLNNRTTIIYGIGCSSNSIAINNTFGVPDNRNLMNSLPENQPSLIDKDESEYLPYKLDYDFKKRHTPQNFDCSVRISIDTFQQALIQAIQCLEKEGIWLRERSTENQKHAKVDDNHFTLQTASPIPVNRRKSSISMNSSVSLRKPGNSPQMPECLEYYDVSLEGSTEVVKYEPSKHSLFCHKEEVNNKTTQTRPPSTLSKIIVVTPAKSFTNCSDDDSENDSELQSICNKIEINDGEQNDREMVSKSDEEESQNDVETISLDDSPSVVQETRGFPYQSPDFYGKELKDGWPVKEETLLNTPEPNTHNETVENVGIFKRFSNRIKGWFKRKQ